MAKHWGLLLKNREGFSRHSDVRYFVRIGHSVQWSWTLTGRLSSGFVSLYAFEYIPLADNHHVRFDAPLRG